MGHGAHDQASHEMAAGAATAPDDPHAGHTMPEQTPPARDRHAGHDMSGAAEGQLHPDTEAGNPLVDMQTMMPAARLDDPGIGLRGNGRRVLTYADLHSRFDDPDGREPGRTIELHL